MARNQLRNHSRRPRRQKLNIAARAGRWSAGHRKTAIWGWILFVVLALAVGGAVGTKTLSDSQSGAISRYLVAREREVARLKRTVGVPWRGVSGLTFRRALGRTLAAL